MNTKQPKQYASAYRLTNCIIIHSLARTAAGFCIATAPYTTLDVKASVTEIGNVIHRALSESIMDVTDTNFQADVKPLLKAAGLRSYRRFVQRAIHCSITKDSQTIWIDPTHNGGTRGDSKGFQYRPDRRVSVESSASSEQLGIALLRGFRGCSSIYQEDLK